jgi:hypothetical protein
VALRRAAGVGTGLIPGSRLYHPDVPADPTAPSSVPQSTVAPSTGWRVGLRWLAIGFALSLPVHAAVVAWLAMTHVSRPGAPAARESLVELAVVGDDGGVALGESDAGGGRPEGPAVDDRSAASTEEPVAAAPLEGGASEGTGLAEGGPLGGGGVGGGAGGGGAGGDGGGSGGGSGTGTGLGSGIGGTTFFGVGGRGMRFAFVVDKSGSMSAEGRLSEAKEELRRAIAALPDYASVYVVFYDTSEPFVFSDRWERVRGTLLKRLERWLGDVGPSGGTNPLPAFRQLYALDARPDVIFFLSDGEIPEGSAGEIRRLNARGRKVTINAIAFGDEAGAARLREVAQESGGEFREVRPRGRGTRTPR